MTRAIRLAKTRGTWCAVLTVAAALIAAAHAANVVEHQLTMAAAPAPAGASQ